MSLKVEVLLPFSPVAQYSCSPVVVIILSLVQCSIMKMFKHSGKLKKVYSGHPCSHHLGSTFNILQHLLYHAPTNLSTHQAILVSDTFQSTSQTSCTSTFTM